MTYSAYPFVSAAFREGAREAFGVPSAVLAAGYVGFGALASENGFSLLMALASTLTIWALPGQLVLVEMHTLGANALAIVAAVMLTSARFLPMTVSLMPLMSDPSHGRGRVFFAAHLLAMTGWAVAMRRFPGLARERRLPYFVGFALTCWLASIAATFAGFFVAGLLPAVVKLGFVFLSPVYFLLILSGEVRDRLWVLALACGALAGPLAHLLSPQWSVMLAGLVGGTVAFLAFRLAGGERD